MSPTGTYSSVVTSPATTTSPVVTSVSTATRLRGSAVNRASSTESLIWSAILSGCPSVTDSDVNKRPVNELSSALSLDWRAFRVAVGGVPDGIVSGRVAEPARGHAVPNHVSQIALGAGRHGTLGAVGREDHGAVVVFAEDPATADVVDDEQVAALPRELADGV